MTNVFLRTLLLYFFVVAVIRLSGKAEVGQLTPSELVFALLIADLAATPLSNDSIPLLHGVLPICALLAGQIILSLASLKSRRMRAILVGRPAILMHRGKIDEAQLAKQCFALDDLLEQLRTQGFRSPAEVETAILEPSGDLSIFSWVKDAPPSAGAIGLAVKETGFCHTLITDGQLSRHALQQSGHDINWLLQTLHQNGVSQIKEVLLLTVDDAGNVFFQKKSKSKASAGGHK